PELVAVGYSHELRADAEAVAGFADAALQDRGDVELLADCSQVRVLALERERRHSRRDIEPVHPGPIVDDVLGDGVATVVVVAVRAQVRERQHRDRPRRYGVRSRGASALGLAKLGEEHGGGLGPIDWRAGERSLQRTGDRAGHALAQRG